MNSPLRKAIHKAMTAPPHRTPAGNLTSSFCCPADFAGFDGHFPSTPILPAVVQVLMGTVATGINSAEILSVSRAKFTRLVKPGEQIDAICDIEPCDSGLSATVRLSVGEETASTFKLTLANEAPRD